MVASQILKGSAKIHEKKGNWSSEELYVSFDYLVIALGASIFPEKFPGFLEAAYNLYDLERAEKIRETIDNFDGGRVVILISSKPFKCPAAPYEAALLLSAYFNQEG